MLNLCKVGVIAMQGNRTLIQATQGQKPLKKGLFFFFHLSRQGHDLTNTLTWMPYPDQKIIVFHVETQQNECVSS